MGLSAGGVADPQLTNPCQQLFRLCPAPGQLIKVWRNQPDKITSIVKQLNWWGRKMKFVEAAVTLMEQHRGLIPQDPALLKRKWIGDKVVECVLGYGYGKPALPVDGNVCNVVFRICGLQFQYDPPDYDSYVRDNLKKFFEPSEWMEVHELLRLHGQAVCGKAPRCSLCNVTICRSRFPGATYMGCGEFAKEAAREKTNSWKEWRRLLLKPEEPVS